MLWQQKQRNDGLASASAGAGARALPVDDDDVAAQAALLN